MTAAHAVESARAGARAIEAHFTASGMSPVTAGDGRFVVYVPGKGRADDLQLALASTPASRGILARVKARRSVAPDDWGRALVLVNKWNRSCPLPHATLSAAGDAGTFLLEGSLPAATDYPEVLVARFVDTVVLGARQFWSGAAVRELTRPWPTTADGRTPDVVGAAAD